MTTRRPRPQRVPPVTVDPFRAGPQTVGHIVALVEQVRPSWDPGLVRTVLLNLADHVDGSDLAIAALRCAKTSTYPTPRAIAWRGPHWFELKSQPAEVRPRDRCGVCGKPEYRCYGERIGRDDDHAFDPVPIHVGAR